MQAQRYVPRKVSDVKSSDSRVSIVGTVSASGENAFAIEDPTGRADVFSDVPVEQGGLVRAFCTSIDGRLKADAVQSLKGFDLNLFQKAEELYRKVGV